MRRKIAVLFLIFLCSAGYAEKWLINSTKISNNYYYPLYKISEILNISIEWNFYTGKFILKNQKNYIMFFLDEDKIYINRELKMLSSPIIRKEGIIYIPQEMINFLFSIVSEKSYRIKFIENESISFEDEKVISSTVQQSNKIENLKNQDEFISQTGVDKREYVIIIDPGHGGEDPGAIGQKGLREKDVVLKTAIKLKEILTKNNPKIKVILTREKDIFLSLSKRAEIANKYINKNTIPFFISIHANASLKKNTKGFETYILSPVASDDEARAVAAMENGLIENVPKTDFSTGKILSQLLSYEYIRESEKLAEFIQNSYNKNISFSIERGVKKALFYVLEGTFMPGVLTEIGFITNSEEEKMMRNDDYLYKIAQSIYEGIMNFIEWYRKEEMFALQ